MLPVPGEESLSHCTPGKIQIIVRLTSLALHDQIKPPKYVVGKIESCCSGLALNSVSSVAVFVSVSLVLEVLDSKSCRNLGHVGASTSLKTTVTSQKEKFYSM